MSYTLFELSNVPEKEIIIIGSSDLQTWWSEQFQGADDYITLEGGRAFQDAFLEYTGHKKQDEKLSFFKGGWTIKIKAGLVKAALSGAFMCSVFSMIPEFQVAASVLPGVIPFLFEIEKISLSKKEDYILAKLLVRDEVKKHLHSADELYDKLPKKIRQDINHLDFLDFLEKLDMAGHIKRKTSGEYQLSGKKRFKITFV
jgi:hypothetical protein